MKFTTLSMSLRAELASAKYSQIFEEARRREHLLARHPNILSVIATLGDLSDKARFEREVPTRVLVREQKKRAHPLWSTALLLAFLPMLCRLRGRIWGDEIAPDDLDQLVIESFLDAVSRIALHSTSARTALRLKQETQRIVFKRLRERQKELQWLDVLAAEAHGDGDFVLFVARARRKALSNEERRELAELLAERVAGKVPNEKLALIIDTLVAGVGLRAHVERLFGGTGARDTERNYQRVKRNRSHVLARIRPMLATESCFC